MCVHPRNSDSIGSSNMNQTEKRCQTVVPGSVSWRMADAAAVALLQPMERTVAQAAGLSHRERDTGLCPRRSDQRLDSDAVGRRVAAGGSLDFQHRAARGEFKFLKRHFKPLMEAGA